MEYKTCTKCGETRDINYFDFRSDTKKYRNICKVCHKGVKEPIALMRIRVLQLAKDGKKECGCCHQVKDVSCFGLDKTTLTKLTSKCKDCIREKGFKERETIEYKRALYQYRYGSTKSDFNDYINKNNCEICGKLLVGKDKCYDHSHKSNAYRGVLCYKCNIGLGFFNDNIKLLDGAIRYLKK